MTTQSVADLWGLPTGRSARVDQLADVRMELIPTDAIEPNPIQPRKEVDTASEAFLELAESIRAQGLLQPILVSQPVLDREVYHLIAGERRWRAMVRLALEPRDTGSARFRHIAATIVTLPVEDRSAHTLLRALAENVTRVDLAAVDRADAVARLREMTQWTYEQIATHMGMTLQRVHDLALLARHEVVKDAVVSGQISATQAVMVARAATTPAKAMALMGKVRGRTVAETRQIVTKESGRKKRAEVRDVPEGCVDTQTLPIYQVCQRRVVTVKDVVAAIEATLPLLGFAGPISAHAGVEPSASSVTYSGYAPSACSDSPTPERPGTGGE